MNKTTIPSVLSVLLLNIGIVPAAFAAPSLPESIITPTIAAASAPSEMAIDVLSIFDTIQKYAPIATKILSGQQPSAAEIGTIIGAVTNGKAYGQDFTAMGIDAVAAVFNPVNPDGQVNLDQTNGDKMAQILKTIAQNKTVSLGDIKDIIALASTQSAAQVVSKQAENATTNNQAVVTNASSAMNQSATTVAALPIGKCDSSLCAENTANKLKAQDLSLKAAAINVAMMNNTYSKINNDQQAIAIKNQQDDKAKQVADNNINNLTSAGFRVNTLNANEICRAAHTCF
jgi:hypothetical protein